MSEPTWMHDEPLEVWVVTSPGGHLGIFATEQLAREHARRFPRGVRAKVEPDIVRFERMHEIDDPEDTPALAEATS